MKSVQEHAQDFVIEFGINDLPVPIGKLKWVARKLGYETAQYNESLLEIEEKGMSDFLSQDSFTVWDPVQQRGVIYVADDLPDDDFRYAMAHELGHIMLHFTGRSGRVVQMPSDPDIRDQQESEADEFARAILAPATILLDIGITMPDEIEDITGIPHRESYKVYNDINRHRNKLADKIYQEKRDESARKNYRRLIRKHEAKSNPYRWVTRICSVLIIILSGIIVWMLAANYVLPAIEQADASPQHEGTSILAAPSSMPELSSSDPQSSEVASSEPEEPEISQPEAPAASASSTAPKEPARSGGEVKTQDRVIYYQVPAQQTPTQQAPAAQEAPQETEPTYTPPAASSKSEPVYSQPPKVVQDDGNTYYWTAGGSVYHSSPSCYHIRDKAQASGILQDALDAGKKRLCYDCPKNN